MSNLEISVKSRSKEDNIKTLAKEGFIVGVVYGHSCDNIAVKANKKDFLDVLKLAGESSLVNVKVDGKELGNVIIKDFQTNPVNGEVIHFDLHKVRMDEKITTNVEIKIVGESPAVKSLGGIMVISHDSLEIKCLPKDLIHEIELDISTLENIDDIIRVKDIKISKDIEILNGEDDVILGISAPRTQTEIDNLEEKPEENVEKVEGAKEDSDKKEENKD